ncbi:3-phosphoinositide-dependent protein kinase 1-like isoform X2 [Lineus longissimus]|uniref:3-phosphoinositide-dependent protein kinase 1-like isoform X2 n=1 Tax=Lineus longissimus TaxID=88925 RepID=UPI00315D42AA
MSIPSPSRTSSTGSDVSNDKKTSAQMPAKKTPNDFKFGKVIGEGSFSTVILAKEVNSNKEYAMKVLEKRHILREKKAQYVNREKEVFNMLSKHNHPFFIKLYFTFQDPERLYFGLSYARRGELLDYIKKLGAFDDRCTKFYSGEIILALEHMHSLGIIHRDLKPENILLNDDMHIQITDFGSAKIIKPQEEPKSDNTDSQGRKRKNSFVGTAQYVSPEVLKGQQVYFSSDLWALGCIIYQLLAGLPPFRGRHEYEIFQKIAKLEYEFPEGFNPIAKELVEKLLVLTPEERLGCEEMGGYQPLKDSVFYKDLNWSILPDQQPPELVPYLPAVDDTSENLWSDYKAGLDEKQLSRLHGIELHDNDKPPSTSSSPSKEPGVSEEERKALLKTQAETNNFHRFVKNNLVLKQGLVDKRKGLFARRRMLLLTEGPHLYYVDPQAMVLKGEIPWSKELRPEAKNFKIFFIHTPNRTYYLEDPQGYALEWVKKIQEVLNRYYGT